MNENTEKASNGGILKGHAALIAANVAWGLMAPISKSLLNRGAISGLALSGIRIMGAALLFWLVGAMFQKYIPQEKIDRKDWIPLFFASLLIIAANQVLIIVGMSYTSPVDASVVCCTSPIFTLALAAILIHERITLLKILGVALGFAGALMFVFTGEVNTSMHFTNPALGNTLCIASQVCGALYLVIFGRIIAKYSAFTLMKWLFTISAIVMIPVSGFSIAQVGWNALPAGAYAETVYIIFFGTFFGYLMIPVAQKVVKPIVISMYNYLQPIVALVCSLIAGLAIINMQVAISTLLIFVGVWLVTIQPKN